MSIDRRSAAARADGTGRPAVAATTMRTQDDPGAPPASDGATPLETMLAVMRWAQKEAERRAADGAAARTGKEADDAAKLIAGLWALALSAAKDAAPYHHARLLAAAARDPSQKTYEEMLLELDREDADSGTASTSGRS